MISLLKKLLSLAVFRHIILTIDIIALPLALYAIYQSNTAIQLQTVANNDQRIATAWSQVSSPAPGNSGKGEAINLLFKNGEELSGMLLDCESMGGKYVQDPRRRCKGAPYIKGLKLIGGTPPTGGLDVRIEDLESTVMDPELCETETPKLNINGTDLSGSVIKNGIIYCGMLIDVAAKDAYFDHMVIANSWLYNFDMSGSSGLSLVRNQIEGLVAENAIFIGSNFDGTHASGINFTGAKFEKVSFAGLEGQNFNVSGADFCYFSNEAFPSTEEHCPESLPDEVVASMWAWSDMPPKGLGATSDKLRSVKLCPAELRKASFGKEYGDFGFVYDRGYQAPDQCSRDTRS